MFMVSEDKENFKFLFVLIYYQIVKISSCQNCQKYNQDNIKHPFKTANLNTSGFPGGAVIKNLPANAGDTGLSPGPGRSHMPRSN